MSPLPPPPTPWSLNITHIMKDNSHADNGIEMKGLMYNVQCRVYACTIFFNLIKIVVFN